MDLKVWTLNSGVRLRMRFLCGYLMSGDILVMFDTIHFTRNTLG